MSDLRRQYDHHDAAVRDAAALVDAARAAGDTAAETIAVAALQAADAARQAFKRQWHRAHSSDNPSFSFWRASR